MTNDSNGCLLGAVMFLALLTSLCLWLWRWVDRQERRFRS